MRPTGRISNTTRKIKGGGSRIYSYIAIAFLSGSSSYLVRAQRVLLMELSMFQFQPDMIHIVVQHSAAFQYFRCHDVELIRRVSIARRAVVAITKACLFTSGRVRGYSSRDTPTSIGVSFDMLIDTTVEPLLLTLEWPMYDGRAWSRWCDAKFSDATSGLPPSTHPVRESEQVVGSELDLYPSDHVAGYPLEFPSLSLSMLQYVATMPRSEGGGSALCVVIVRVDHLVESAPLKSIVQHSSTLPCGGTVARQ
ncbi:hypothetical protein EDD16DRAFT_85001 [Pisolithus croceorrhizus]|nr:hypothetical protein EDD16DRAFT_85001 [Pisolithus croceorrhizus]